MRRYFFYPAIALFAFVTGSFIVLNFYWQTVENTNDIKFSISAKIAAKKNDLTEPVFYQTVQITADDKKEIKQTSVCTDGRLLPLWNEVKKDKEFKERTEGSEETADCAEMFELQKVDLNGDGQKEFVLWGRYARNLCGGTGNCAVWIYEKRKDKYRLLLQATAYYDASKWFEVKKTKTNGYRDILLKGHFTAADTTLDFYKFDGKKYVADKCLMSSYHSYNDKTSVTPCAEYFKKLEN